MPGKLTNVLNKATLIVLTRSILLCCCVSLITLTTDYVGMYQRNEWILYDWMLQQLRNHKPLPDDIVVILIDDVSLQALDHSIGRWPWPRAIYSEIINFINMGAPKAILFDVLFVEKQLEQQLAPQDITNDAKFINATKSAGNIHHAMQFLSDDLNNQTSFDTPQKLPTQLVDKFMLKNQGKFDDLNNVNSGNYNNFLIPIEGLYQAAAGLGVVTVSEDRDGVLRKSKLAHLYQNALFPALSISAIKNKIDINCGITQCALQYNHATIPTSHNGDLLIKYYGSYDSFSISGILSSINSINQGDVENLLIDPEEFRDKYVFIGTSALGLHDLKTTPISEAVPGVIMHASILANVLNQDYIGQVWYGVSVMGVVLTSFVCAFLVLISRSFFLQIVWPILILAIVTIITHILFSYSIYLQSVVILISILLTWISTYSYLIFTEEKEKNKVRKMFSQYVSPAALKIMIDDYASYAQAGSGSKETVSMLFSDIRGFTSLSEKLNAEKIVETLNFYLSEMTKVIHLHSGTVDKFIGDAIMATWGAPIRTLDHAQQAVLAAIDMIKQLESVNSWLDSHQLEKLDIGIGINTGEVILGSIGSEQKADYTVIGDNVNLASRLEGITKTYQLKIIISEFTRIQLQSIPCLTVDVVRVKGKKRPITIYAPLYNSITENTKSGISIPCFQELETLSLQAFNAYRQQNWDQAIALYTQLPFPTLQKMFIQRCQHYKKHPTPTDWDGVHTMTSK